MVFRKRMERAAAAVAAASTIGRRSGLAVSHGMGAAGLCQRHLRASVGTACGVRVLMLMPMWRRCSLKLTCVSHVDCRRAVAGIAAAGAALGGFVA